MSYRDEEMTLECLMAFMKKLHQPCACERGDPRKECKENPINRWWETYLLEGQKK